MLGHLARALRRLFPSRAARAEVVALVLVMAAVPVVEMLVGGSAGMAAAAAIR